VKGHDFSRADKVKWMDWASAPDGMKASDRRSAFRDLPRR